MLIIKKLWLLLAVLPCLTLSAQTLDDILCDIKTDTPLKEFTTIKALAINDIKSLKILHYAEDGIKERNITAREDVQKILSAFDNIIVGCDSGIRCTDDTTLYIFTLENGSNIEIERECESLIIDKQYYSYTKRK